MGMRVISGKAKGRLLQRVPGDTTRPIMDRVKESLFNILGPAYVVDQVWLDLFAGTGQVGIEALSRGARQVIFLDTARAAIQTIQANLRLTGLADAAQVWQMDAFAYLRAAPAAFDVIYIAPPQYQGLWHAALQAIDAHAAVLLRPQGLVVVQLDPREYQDIPCQALELSDSRRYGNTQLCFYTLIAP